MKERKPKDIRARGAGALARPRSKAAEASRDPKVSAPAELRPDPKPAEAAKVVGGDTPPASTGPAASPVAVARDEVGMSKPAPAAKAAAPTMKPGVRSPAETPTKVPATPLSAKPPAGPFKADPVAKSAPPAPAQTAVVAQPAPAPRPVETAKPVQDLERAVRAATAAAVEPTPALLEAMSAASQSVAARMVETGAEAVRRTSADLRSAGETTSRAMTDTGSSASRGWIELNGKMLDVLRAQSDAAFAVWRETVTARSFPDAVRAQTTGLQHLYETSTVQWREVAEAAARLMGDAAKPMGAVWPNRRV